MLSNGWLVAGGIFALLMAIKLVIYARVAIRHAYAEYIGYEKPWVVVWVGLLTLLIGLIVVWSPRAIWRDLRNR